MLTVNDILEGSAARYGEKAAVRCGSLTVSFRELNENVNRVAWALQRDCQLRKGERVAILVPSSPEFLYVYLGVMKAGAVAAPFNLALGVEEMVQIGDDMEPSAIIASSAMAKSAAALASRLASVRAKALLGDEKPEGWTHLDARMLAVPAREPDSAVDANDTAACLYTSGTTGRPKGILLSHGNLVSDVKGMQAKREWELGVHVFGCPLPLHHVFPVVTLVLFPFSIGATVVLIPKFTPDGCLATISGERVTFFSGVPPMFTLFTKVREPERFDVSSCKYWISGAASIPLTVQRRFRELFGTPLHQGYGLTETSAVLTWNLKEDKPQSVGQPLRNVELRILDDSGVEVPIGEVGEVVVRGPNVMQGYHRAPEATAAVLKDGWFSTGDLGRIDSDRDLTLVGRKKELIIVGGENVSPEEIDEVLRSHEDVEDAAVVGIHDALRGEAIKAFVVRKAGSHVEGEDLLRYCRSKLARIKVPRQIEFVEGIPRNATGKVLRRRLASGDGMPAA